MRVSEGLTAFGTRKMLYIVRSVVLGVKRESIEGVIVTNGDELRG